MSEHEIVWTFEGDYIRPRVVCSAPLGADCRLGPIADSILCHCEEWFGIERDEHGPYHVLPTSLGDEKHRMEDSGECNVAQFLNLSDLIEESAVDKPSFEIGRTPIEPVWQGEYYDWKPVTA